MLRDNDDKYSPSFDAVFASECLYGISLPYQASNANAHVERWVRTAREACLDHILVWNDGHLLRVLNDFVVYYNSRRPHQSVDQQSPLACTPPEVTGHITCCQVLDGIINNYHIGLLTI